jgi:hypothetical protein
MMFFFKQLKGEATLTGAGLTSERSAEGLNSRKKNGSDEHSKTSKRWQHIRYIFSLNLVI